MKKIYTLVAAFAMFIGAANAQCTIDANNTDFVAPPQDSFPCIERTVAFSEAIQLSIPGTFTTPLGAVSVDSVVITDITGFPVGISYQCNPTNCTFYGGTNACINFSGTTTDTVGNYQLTFDGTIYVNTPLGAQSFGFDQAAQLGGPSVSYAVDVINQGDECRPAPNGIGSVKQLNGTLSVMPNPTNGIFEVRLNNSEMINGDLLVIDAQGRVVYSEKVQNNGLYNTTIDITNFAKGLYSVQLRTAQGVATKPLSVN
jgi:hypothetical protein